MLFELKVNEQEMQAIISALAQTHPLVRKLTDQIVAQQLKQQRDGHDVSDQPAAR